MIAKGLAKDPTERFASASELILAAKTALLPDPLPRGPADAAYADIAAAFDTLRRAKTLAFGGVGITNVAPPAAKTFAAIRAVGSDTFRSSSSYWTTQARPAACTPPRARLT